MNTWLDELAVKHRATGVLLDASLLVLWIAGAIDQSLIKTHKRLSSYGEEHFDALRVILSRVARLLTTPHVLAEASNLAKQTSQPARDQLLEAISRIVGITGESQRVWEEHVPAAELCRNPNFVILGVVDTAMLEVARSRGPLVVTDDNTLLAKLAQEKLDSLSILRLVIR